MQPSVVTQASDGYVPATPKWPMGSGLDGQEAPSVPERICPVGMTSDGISVVTGLGMTDRLA
jgi:hypothetical protein